MNQQHDGVDPLSLQFGGLRVRRVGLVQKRQVAIHGGGHDLAGVGEGLADESDLDPAHGPNRGRWKQRRPGRLPDDVRGQVLEPCAVEAVAVLTAVLGVAATATQPQDFFVAFVELVVADRRHASPSALSASIAGSS